MPTGRVVAILPAAGDSRRMGRPKLLLPLHGGPMVAGVVNALFGGGAEEIVLVTSPGDEDSRKALAAGVDCAVNRPSRRRLPASARIAALAEPSVLVAASISIFLPTSPLQKPRPWWTSCAGCANPAPPTRPACRSRPRNATLAIAPR